MNSGINIAGIYKWQFVICCFYIYFAISLFGIHFVILYRHECI